MRFPLGSVVLAVLLMSFGCGLSSAEVTEALGDTEAETHDVAALSGALAMAGESPPTRAGTEFRRLAVLVKSAAALSVRTSTDGATWSSWRPLERAWQQGGGGLEVQRADLSAPARWFQLQGQAKVVMAETLAVVGPAGSATQRSSSSTSQGLSFGEVVPRAAWGAQAPACTSGALGTVRFATVHHTAAAGDEFSSDPAATLRGIQSFHIFGRGWCDIGYHFLVSADGRVWQGADETRLGTHTGGANTGNLGVNFLGNYVDHGLNPTMLCKGAEVLSMLAARHPGIALDRSGVKGHGEWFGDTACPGGGALAQLDEMVARAAAGLSCGGAPKAPPKANRFFTVTGDFDGDGRGDVATLSPDAWSQNGGVPASWGAWVAMERSTGNGFHHETWAAATPAHMRNAVKDADYRVLAADFDGDGKTDLATISPDAWSPNGTSPDGFGAWVAIERSTGTGFKSETWRAALPAHLRNGQGKDSRIVTGDFNGDGKADLAALSPDAWSADGTQPRGFGAWIAVELSTGSGFKSHLWPAATPAHLRNGGKNKRYDVRTGDFNGDGKTDLATISPDAWSSNSAEGWGAWVSMELSTGTGFTSQLWPAATPAHLRNGGSAQDYRVLTGDFDGNGLTDLATLSPNAAGSWDGWVSVELSTGTAFHSTTWPATTPTHMRNGGSAKDYRVIAADFDGDRRTDLATLSPDAWSENGGVPASWGAWVAMERSTGTGFRHETWAAATPAHLRNGGLGKDYRVLALDTNGDRKADLVSLSPDAWSPSSADGWGAWFAVEQSTGLGFTSGRWPATTPMHMRNGRVP